MNNQFCHYIINPLKDKRQGGYYSVLLYLIRECFSYQKKTKKQPAIEVTIVTSLT